MSYTEVYMLDEVIKNTYRYDHSERCCWAIKLNLILKNPTFNSVLKTSRFSSSYLFLAIILFQIFQNCFQLLRNLAGSESLFGFSVGVLNSILLYMWDLVTTSF